MFFASKWKMEPTWDFIHSERTDDNNQWNIMQMCEQTSWPSMTQLSRIAPNSAKKRSESIHWQARTEANASRTQCFSII